MIAPDQRLYTPNGCYNEGSPHSPAIWNTVDFDTRKWIMFEGPVEPFGRDDGQLAEETLLGVIDQLEDDVTKITFTADGKRWKATKLPNDNITPVVSYPKFTAAEVGHLVSIILQKDMWEEIDRIGPGLDVIRTRGANPQSPEELFVFKYYLVPRPRAQRTAWTGAFYHRAVSAHQNVVPFGDFVVDEGTQQLVGCTTKYIPGGSLDTRHLSVFKRSWIKQLTDLVNDLNLRYGLFHQDIAPRNLILDEKQDRLLLFDFETAALHGTRHVSRISDDVTGLCFTVYEILTGDDKTYHKRDTQKLHLIMSSAKRWQLKENIKLEPGVSTKMIKNELLEWIQERQKLTPSFELRESIYCPEMKIERPKDMHPAEYETEPVYAAYIIDADPNARIVRWERPSSAQLRLHRSVSNRAKEI